MPPNHPLEPRHRPGDGFEPPEQRYAATLDLGTLPAPVTPPAAPADADTPGASSDRADPGEPADPGASAGSADSPGTGEPADPNEPAEPEVLNPAGPEQDPDSVARQRGLRLGRASDRLRNRSAERGQGFPAQVSLQAKLLTLLLIAMVAGLAVTGYGVQAVLRGYLVGQIDDQLSATVVHAHNDPRFLNLLSRGGGESFPSSYLIQFCVDGSRTTCQVQAGYASDEAQSAPTFPLLSNAQATARGNRPYTLVADGSSWRAQSFPVTVNFTNGTSSPASVTIAESLGGVDHAVARLRLLSLIFGACVMVLGLILGGLAIRRAFAPLVEVEETAAAIAAGDLSRRVPERPASTEVGRLTSSLNGMLNQIETAFHAREASEARTRRFAADASHELRTPLAAIRGFAELYRQGAVPGDEVPRTMRRIEDEATRMGGLVEDLLLLARLDEQRPGRAEPVDLAVLAGDAVHDMRGLDPDRPVRLIGLEPSPGPVPAVVIGDEDRLRQVVTNLVVNAVRHTPAGTPVEIAVGVLPKRPDAPASAALEVRDHGGGLTPEQAERVFERFYRLDGSRSRGSGGGSGLGLSIVAAVVAAHRGRVTVMPTPGGGATFRVEIPLPPPAPAPAPSPGRGRSGGHAAGAGSPE